MEKILKEIHVTPKIELTQEEYNKLVSLAQIKAKKIEERAREFYEKEGVVKVMFQGRIISKRYGEYGEEIFDFDCKPGDYSVTPSGDFEKTLFTIPQKERQRIAKKVGKYVESVFKTKFGESLLHLNEIQAIKAKLKRQTNLFIVCTLTGWLAALILVVIALVK